MKKRFKLISLIAIGAAVLFAVVSIFMLLGAGFTVDGGRFLGTYTYSSCFAMIFGGKGTVAVGSTSTSVTFAASAGLIIAFVLLLLGLLWAIVSLVGVLKGKKVLILALGAAVFFLVAGIMFLASKGMILASDGNGGSASYAETFGDSMKLGWGFVMAGIFGIVSGVACLLQAALGFIKK